MQRHDLARLIRVHTHDMLESAERRQGVFNFHGHAALRELREQIAAELGVMEYLETIAQLSVDARDILPG